MHSPARLAAARRRATPLAPAPLFRHRCSSRRRRRRLFNITTDIRVSATGRLEVTTNIEPVRGAFHRCVSLARVGMALKLPPGFGHVEWFGRGPFECYQDRKVGVFSFLFFALRDLVGVSRLFWNTVLLGTVVASAVLSLDPPGRGLRRCVASDAVWKRLSSQGARDRTGDKKLRTNVLLCRATVRYNTSVTLHACDVCV